MITKFDKAISGFVVSFVAALVAEVQIGSPLTPKTILLALGTAIVTSWSVYQTKNKGAA